MGENVSTLQTEPPFAPTVKRGSSLRVLMVTEAAAKGTGRHVLDLAQGLIARGCEVHLLYSPLRMDETFRKRMWSMEGLVHVRLEMKREVSPNDLSAAWKARRYIRYFGPFDLIHGHSSKGGAIARLAGLLSGTPVVYTPHALVTMSPDLSPVKRWVFESAEWMLSKMTRKIIAVGPEEARFAISTGLSRGRVVIVPNGVEAQTFPPKDEARQNCGLRKDHIVVGWIGRLVESKAPDLLIRAAAGVLGRVPQLRVVFIGNGPQAEELKTLTAALNLEEKIVFMGEVDARRFLPAFDIFAMTSRMEGMPYVILEAMSAGLPIIATTTSGAELLIKPSVNGVVIPTDDLELLTNELGKLASDASLRSAMGAASLARVAHFSIDRMVDRVCNVYENVLGSASAFDDEPLLAGQLRD